MGNSDLTPDEIRHLVKSWQKAPSGSHEKKLIEDLFLITNTPLPKASGDGRAA